MAVNLQTSEQLVPTGTWSIDRAHSAIEFRIRHLMLASVKGRFNEFEGALEARPDGEAQITGVVRAASIDTREPQRDAHLRSAEFFDVETYPELSFASTAVEAIGESRFRVAGDLTIRDVTRPVELVATVLGTARDPSGNERLGIEAVGELDRTDFGLTWNAARETGGALVGDVVKFEIDVSAIRQV